jgi:orotate phosphoribosyltransferase
LLRERLKELFHELNCIQYGKFKLASGGISNYKIFSDPLFENSESREIISAIGFQVLQEIESEKTYEIVGIVTGGYEFAKLVAEKAGREAISINPHNNKIKGILRERNICYFEDVVTKGGSILKCHNIIKNFIHSIEDEKAVCMVDREENGRYNLIKNGIELESILTKGGLSL